MRKSNIITLAIFLLGTTSITAQIRLPFSKKKKTDSTLVVSTPPKFTKKTPSKLNLTNRSSDHFMFQIGTESWIGKPDSITTKGLGRHFNMYVMLDKPFKSNPYFSVGYGLGFGSSNIYFDNQTVAIGANTSSLGFPQGGTHFNKYKLTTIYIEAPVEIRYFANPENPNKGWKGALGLKLGTLFKAYTKGKDKVDGTGNSLYGSSYIEKAYSRKFITGTKVALTGRVGWGNFSLHADYTFTPVIKQGFGTSINTLSIGLVVSGL